MRLPRSTRESCSATAGSLVLEQAKTALADAHLHLFRHGYRGQSGGSGAIDVERYEQLMLTHGIIAGLVVGYEAGGIDPYNNSYLRMLAATRPWLTSTAFLTPTTFPSAADIADLLDQGHRGITLYLRDLADTEAVTNWPIASWRLLAQNRALISVNAQPAATAGLSGLARAHPDCTFLFAHLGLPGRFRSTPTQAAAASRIRPLLELGQFDNCMVKISGFYAISDPPQDYPHAAAAPFLDLLLARFGAKRCLWGSDYSPSLEHVSFAQTFQIPSLEQLSATERQLILGHNLIDLLH